jgi:CRISPR-associated protein Cas1
MSVERRREKIDPKHKRLSVVRHCAQLQISRSGHYCRPTSESEDALVLMRLGGEAASVYFGVFAHLVRRNEAEFSFTTRSRRPSLDRINALLSFLYPPPAQRRPRTGE